MTRSISIHDIARAAGVSHTTVSRALHNNALISADVRSKIQQLAHEMGYTPNAVAQSLKGQRTHTIGLVVTTIADPFVGRVVRGIEEVAQKANLSVFLGNSFNDPEREMSIIESFHRRRVDGIIVAAAQINAQYSRRLARINVPTVLINQQAETQYELLHTVTVDDYTGAWLAVQHLLSLGHRRIGYLGAGNRPRSNRLRMAAYMDAMAEKDITPPKDWVKVASPESRYHTDDVADGQSLSLELIQSKITAIFCYNDMLATGALLTCRKCALSVPAELSLIGFDDIELAQYVTPPLTTIHQPKLRLGQNAMHMLLNLLQGETVTDLILSPQLVIRASTALAPRKE